MAIETRQRIVQARRVVVVQQQPHLHAAPGRLQQRAEQQASRHIVLPDVILHIQRALRFAHQQIAGRESVEPVRQRMNAAQAGVAGTARADNLLKPADVGQFGQQI